MTERVASATGWALFHREKGVDWLSFTFEEEKPPDYRSQEWAWLRCIVRLADGEEPKR